MYEYYLNVDNNRVYRSGPAGDQVLHVQGSWVSDSAKRLHSIKSGYDGFDHIDLDQVANVIKEYYCLDDVKIKALLK